MNAKKKFAMGRRYYSEDGCDLFICGRSDGYRLRAEVCYGMPANYKIQVDAFGCECVTALGHTFRADH